MAIEDFECEYCGEETDGSVAFHTEIEFDDGTKESHRTCPTCIATFFTEVPDEIETMIIIKDIVKED